MHAEIIAAETAIEQLGSGGAQAGSATSVVHTALFALLTLCRSQQAEIDSLQRRLEANSPPLDGVTMDV